MAYFTFQFGFNYGWMLLIFALTAAYAVICPIITPFGLFYLVMKHGVDRYNLYYAYKRSKISKQIHATAVNSVIVSLLIQQLVLLFFNVIRGQKTDESSGFSPRAIFSITMFAIFLAMFVGQMFFHVFLGFSPIQYNPTIESPPRSNKNSNASSRRGSNGGLEEVKNKKDDLRNGGVPAEEANGIEPVYGEFGQFARHTDVGIQFSSCDDVFQIPEDDVFGNHRLTNRRHQRHTNSSTKKSEKRYMPDVLRYNVFSADQNTHTQSSNKSLGVPSPYNSNESKEHVDGSSSQTESGNISRVEKVSPSATYGAIQQQPKGLDNIQKKV